MTADENSLLGSCDLGYICAYSSTVVFWLTLPLMAEHNSRVLFRERMLGPAIAPTPAFAPGAVNGQMLQNSASPYRNYLRRSRSCTAIPLMAIGRHQVILLFGSGFPVGGGAGTIKGGRHLIYPEHTPFANPQLALLNKLGVPAESLGDSNGQFGEVCEL